ncbi:MAG: PAS domain S-box protein [Deltaproteobacteria bacterium]|jgi:diguanylate cyclase (GGDEF)-like protein/PAS domain S-box-containing protein|nr:PAS domain S-box protein [Deltaproteobacteria bacterium]
MNSYPPPEQLLQQVASLKEELTACRKTKASLQHNELKYRNLVESANEAILVAQNGTFQYANPKAEALFGYSYHELTSKPISAFIHKQDVEMVLQHHEGIITGQHHPERVSFRIVNKAETTIWVELKASLFSWNDQPATLGVLTDITQRKQVEDKYYRVLNSRFEGYMLLDENRVIIEVNKALLKISGYDRDDFIGQLVDKFYDKASLNFYSASHDHFSFEALFCANDGRLIPMLFSRSSLNDENNQITGFMVFLTDLTDLKETQEELKKAEQRYRNMYQNALQGMFQSRLSGELIRVNPAYARILGYDSVDEVMSLKEGSDKFYFSSEDRDRMIRAVRKKGAVANHELQLKRKDGKPVWILANIRYIESDETGGILEGILVDNTKKKALEKELRRDRKKFRNLAIHDNLTGLYNTRHLYQILDKLIEDSKLTRKPFSLVFMDMDNFKRVVDTYGHLNGSQALKEVAHTIKDCLNRPCFGVAYGGDEFVIVLPGFDKTRASELVGQIRKQMMETAYLAKAGYHVNLGASFGIATFPDDTDNREGLLALADQAMFHVKQTGKGLIGKAHS